MYGRRLTLQRKSSYSSDSSLSDSSSMSDIGGGRNWKTCFFGLVDGLVGLDLLILGILAFWGGADADKRSINNARNIESSSGLLLPAYYAAFSVRSAEMICFTCSRATSCFLTSIGTSTFGTGKGGVVTAGACNICGV